MRAPFYQRYKKIKYYGLGLPSIIGILCLAVIAAVGISSYLQKGPLPDDIEKSINFTAYIPPDSSNGFHLEPSLTTYSKDTGVLSMVAINESEDNKIKITQQALPELFKDIPQYYPQLLAKLNQYSEFQSAYGTVTLTKPTELKGGQSAVSTAGGTLLFAHPDKNLSVEEWKNFFNSLEVIK